MKTSAKKKWLGVMLVLAIEIMASYNVYVTSRSDLTLSGLELANVEALAQGENRRQRIFCYNTMEGLDGGTKRYETYCGGCAPVICTHWYTENHCIRP